MLAITLAVILVLGGAFLWRRRRQAVRAGTKRSRLPVQEANEEAHVEANAEDAGAGEMTEGDEPSACAGKVAPARSKKTHATGTSRKHATKAKAATGSKGGVSGSRSRRARVKSDEDAGRPLQADVDTPREQDEVEPGDVPHGGTAKSVERHTKQARGVAGRAARGPVRVDVDFD